MAQQKQYSQIRALLSITKASLKSLFRNPSTVVFSILFPLIFILVFGFIGNGNSIYKVYLDSSSDKNNFLYKTLTENSSIKILSEQSANEYEKELTQGKIDAIITIIKVSEKPDSYKIDLKTSAAAPQGGAVVNSILNSISTQTNLQSAIATNQSYKPVVSIDKKEVQGRKYKSIDFILPGQLGFSLLNVGVFGTAFVFLNLRNTLVLKRFFATPISRASIILGEGLSRLIFAVIQASIIIGIGAAFLGFTLVHGPVTVLNMLLLAMLGLTIFLGVGFIVSGLAKDENAVPALANIFTLPQFLLAGTFFPIENFPKWLQPVSNILPLTYLNNAMRKVAFEGANITNVGKELLVLLIWGVVVYFFAVRFFKWDPTQ